MRKFRALALLLLAACGGSATAPIAKPKPDPFITIRLRDQLDTTTAPGRAMWHVYTVLTGPYNALNGVNFKGSLDITGLRLGRSLICVSVGADSVGQRLVSVLALADTTTSQFTDEATALRMATAWYGGNHTLDAGWMAIASTPTDAWTSAQYTAGHGLVDSDPIKWGLDWTGRGTVAFYERTDSDPSCSRF